METIESNGPGKYDHACSVARALAGGQVMLIVIGGVDGSGFSCQFTSPDTVLFVPGILRDVADQIEHEHEKTQTE